MSEEKYKALIEFGNAYRDVIKELNDKTIKEFDDKKTKQLMNDLVHKQGFSDGVADTIRKTLSSMVQGYTSKLIMQHSNIINEKMINAISEFQIGIMYRISQSIKTEMIRGISSCFTNARFDGIAQIINKTMKMPIIQATDLAFLRTSDLIDVLGKEIIYPRGMITSLRKLNKQTADIISLNNSLEYDVERNVFTSSQGEVDSKGLNVICSGKQILSDSSGEIFTEDELIDFTTYLSRTLTLGGTTETGKKIISFIKELFSNNEKTIGFDKDKYYHCRSHEKGIMPFTYDQMLKAPYGLPWPGRFNHAGRSHYYFADTRLGAEAEVKKHMTNEDELQTVIIKPVKEIKLLDLSGTLKNGKLFLKYLRFSLSDVNDKMPREYLLPCYVADCCKVIGFEGIKYTGSKEYYNYVTWDDGYFEYVGMCESI